MLERTLTLFVDSGLVGSCRALRAAAWKQAAPGLSAEGTRANSTCVVVRSAPSVWREPPLSMGALVPFLAIVLVCSAAVSIETCDEAQAIDIMSVRVANELHCTMGWQEIIARSSLREGVGAGTYLKTACRRVPTGEAER